VQALNTRYSVESAKFAFVTLTIAGIVGELSFGSSGVADRSGSTISGSEAGAAIPRENPQISDINFANQRHQFPPGGEDMIDKSGDLRHRIYACGIVHGLVARGLAAQDLSA